MTDHDPGLAPENSERVQRIEMAIRQLGKTLGLQLTDMLLIEGGVDTESKEKLNQLRSALTRVSVLALELAEDVTNTLDQENPHTPALSEQRFDRGEKKAAASVDARGHDKGELYDEIVPLGPVSEEALADPETIKITVTSGNTLEINGEKINLQGHQLFLFNALNMLRDEDLVTSERIREVGFKTGKNVHTAFSTSMAALRQTLTQVSGIDIVERVPWIKKKLRYRFDPRVVFIDRRRNVAGRAVPSDNTPQLTTETLPVVVDNEIIEDDSGPQDERDLVSESHVSEERSFINPEWFEGSPSFELAPGALKRRGNIDVPASRLRRNIASTISVAYKDHPAVHKAEKSLLKDTEVDLPDKSKQRTIEEYINEKLAYSSIALDDERQLLEYIARAVALYDSLESFENISEEVNDSFVKAAIAQRMLFVANARTVIDFVQSKPTPRGMSTLELICAGNVGLSWAIKSPEFSHIGPLEKWAPRFIEDAIDAYRKGRMKIKHPSGEAVTRDRWNLLEGGVKPLPVDKSRPVSRSSEDLAARIKDALPGIGFQPRSRSRHRRYSQGGGRNHNTKVSVEDALREFNAQDTD